MTAVLLAGCAGVRAPGDGGPAPAKALRARKGAAGAYRVALFPAENLSAAAVPTRGIDGEIARVLSSAGLQVVSGELVERFLEQHRLRYTGGVDGPAAAAAREELGVDGILLTTIELYDAESVPRIAFTLRVVDASADARIVWMDGFARAGNDAPGFLGLGLVARHAELEGRELKRLADSLVATIEGRADTAPACPADRRFRPRIVFRSPRFDPRGSYSVAVLPFVNEASRRRAGDLVPLELVRQFAAVPRLRVLEPGVVRERLIRSRVVMEGGISVDVARLMLDTLNADLVVAGYVREFSDGGDPSVDFTVLVLERQQGAIMWESTSHATADDGVWFFDVGRISTATALTCRMGREIVNALVGNAGH